MRTIASNARINGEFWQAIYGQSGVMIHELPEKTARYRFLLKRIWDDSLPIIATVGLNPSKATHLISDPTVTRVVGDAKDLGYGGMFMLNIWPARTPKPELLKSYIRFYEDWNEAEAENLNMVIAAAKEVKTVVAAWGGNGAWLGQGERLFDHLIRAGIQLMCYKTTSSGEPWHRLYIENNTPLKQYSR